MVTPEVFKVRHKPAVNREAIVPVAGIYAAQDDHVPESLVVVQVHAGLVVQAQQKGPPKRALWLYRENFDPSFRPKPVSPPSNLPAETSA